MKTTTLPGLRYWSLFQADRGIDFNGFCWTRPGGSTVLIDPMPVAPDALAPVRASLDWIVLTNADHARSAADLRKMFDLKVTAPDCDREALSGLQVDAWYGPNQALPTELSDLEAHWLHGGKTAHEAALWIPACSALLFGDAVRSHTSGELRLLPPEKLSDAAALRNDVRKLARFPTKAVLLGDGDCIFHGAATALERLVESFEA